MAEYMDPAMDAIEDAAGTAAEEAYMAAMQDGASPADAAAAAIDAASGVMTDMGAPPEMVDTMATAAQEGFDQAIENGLSPQDAFDAAGENVDAAFGDGPPPGDMGPGPDGPMGPPPGDMGPGPDGPMGPPPGDMGRTRWTNGTTSR